MAVTTARTTRRTDALSKARIIAAAVEILDAGGESALTFRALASRLSTGPGAIYWHVSNKSELQAAATNAVVGEVLSAAPTQEEPPAQIRAIGLGLFDAIDAHPWIGSHLARDPWQLANVRILEAVGGKLTALGVAPRSQFDVATALTSYICGAASQNATNARNAPLDMDRTATLTMAAKQWEALGPTDYPFVHQIQAQLMDHDDREQFLTGIDLILAGIADIAGH